MISLRKPQAEAIRRFLTAESKLPFTYAAVGATARIAPGQPAGSEAPPAGYDLDHTRFQLGEGEAVFQAAKAALARWEHFRLGWVEALPGNTPIRPGEVVAVAARAFGAWTTNSCRIVYVVDEPGPICKFGFAYGTLPGHVEKGEERFLIEWDRGTDSVCYDILAFSRPNHILTRLGYPLMRRFQKRFGRDSVAAMLRAAGTVDKVVAG